ncbi:MAG: hypothetical protein AAFQ36_03055 [Pseudomonadota bacterium]
MPKGPDGQKRPADVIGGAVMVAKIATGETEDTGYVSKNRRKSGVAGAEARKIKLDAERRSEIATQAAIARWQKGEKEMTESCSASLHDLLSEGGRELQNIKFLAGTDATSVGICKEAERVIRAALEEGMPHNPPHSGREKSKL